MLGLVERSLADSTRVAYHHAWEEFRVSGALRRDGSSKGMIQRREDVLRFIILTVEKGSSVATIAGKLSGISFMDIFSGAMNLRRGRWGRGCYRIGLKNVARSPESGNRSRF